MSGSVTSRISLRGKLVLTFVLLLGGIIGVGLFAVRLLFVVNKAAAELTNSWLPSTGFDVDGFVAEVRAA